MKKYKVICDSVTTNKGLTYTEGQEIPEVKLRPEDVKHLLDIKAIEEVKPAEAPAEKKK